MGNTRGGLGHGVRMAGPTALLCAAGLAVTGCQSAGGTDTAAPAAPVAVPTEDVAETLREVERSRLQALVDADMDVVESLHAEDFVLIPPPGFSMTREEYLAAVESGDLDYMVFEPVSDIEVRVLAEDAAVLTYRSRIHIDAAGQGELDHEAWHTYVFQEGAGGWQLVWEQATAVGGFPPP